MIFARSQLWVQTQKNEVLFVQFELLSHLGCSFECAGRVDFKALKRYRPRRPHMIIESLLDTDLYKFTMQQCVLHQFPAAEVSYRFKCRTPNIDLSPFIDEINAEIDHLCSLYFKDDELEYLGNLRFMKSDFIEFLSLFHLKRKYITVERDPSRPFGIDIRIKGPWLHTILFEIPVLAIVNEVYFRRTYPGLSDAEGRRRLDAKIDLLLNEPHAEDLHISDYGTRRRFSREWQRAVIERLSERLGSRLSGTSNVLLPRNLVSFHSARWRTNTFRPVRRLALVCATRRSSGSNSGPKSIAATWGLRFLTSTA